MKIDKKQFALNLLNLKHLPLRWSKIKEKTLSQRKKNEQRTGKSQKKTGKESSC